jgi:hypothetical protein
MAIANLSSQYISSSFQNLMQISSSNAVYNGAGNQVTTLLVSASYATTSSYALNAAAGSQGIAGSNGTQGIQGIQGIYGTQGVQGTSVQGATGAGTQGTIGSQGATGTSIQGTSGAAGTPGGSSGEVQYNNGASAFAGSSNLTVDGSGVTKFIARLQPPDVDNQHLISHRLDGSTYVTPNSDGFVLSGTRVLLPNPAGATVVGQIFGCLGSGTSDWQFATSVTDYVTGSLAIIITNPSPIAGSSFEAYLPGTIAAINLTTSAVWDSSVGAFEVGKAIYLSSAGKVRPVPPTAPGNHVRVLGHVYQTWNDTATSDLYATFLFNPDGNWITL